MRFAATPAILAILAARLCAVDADPVVTDGDKYRVVLENESVRVLRYDDKPGDRTHQHTHPASVLIAHSALRRRLTFPDGTTKEVALKDGDAMWVGPQTHIGENIGDTETHVILIELKAPTAK